MVKENSLGVVNMGITDTDSFLSSLVGNPVTFWIGREPIYYSLSELTEYSFRELSERTKVIVFFGKNDKDKFAVDCNYGFGVRVQGTKTDYWIDKINEKEAVVIQYYEIEKEPDAERRTE